MLVLNVLLLAAAQALAGTWYQVNNRDMPRYRYIDGDWEIIEPPQYKQSDIFGGTNEEESEFVDDKLDAVEVLETNKQDSADFDKRNAMLEFNPIASIKEGKSKITDLVPTSALVNQPEKPILPELGTPAEAKEKMSVSEPGKISVKDIKSDKEIPSMDTRIATEILNIPITNNLEQKTIPPENTEKDEKSRNKPGNKEIQAVKSIGEKNLNQMGKFLENSKPVESKHNKEVVEKVLFSTKERESEKKQKNINNKTLDVDDKNILKIKEQNKKDKKERFQEEKVTKEKVSKILQYTKQAEENEVLSPDSKNPDTGSAVGGGMKFRPVIVPQLHQLHSNQTLH